jgi:hypothetical protein
VTPSALKVRIPVQESSVGRVTAIDDIGCNLRDVAIDAVGDAMEPNWWTPSER